MNIKQFTRERHWKVSKTRKALWFIRENVKYLFGGSVGVIIFFVIFYASALVK